MRKIILTILLLLTFPFSASALQFDAVDDYVQMTSTTSLQPVSAFTVSAWVNTTSPGAVNSIINKYGVIGRNYRFYVFANVATFEIIGNGGTDSVSSVTTIATSTWTHVAAVFDGSVPGIYIYINGKLDASNLTGISTSVTASTRATCIGVQNGGTTACSTNSLRFAGNMDDVRAFNRALSAQEVRLLYGGSNIRNGLVGHWTLIGNNTTFEPDFSGLGNSGTPINGPLRGPLHPARRFPLIR